MSIAHSKHPKRKNVRFRPEVHTPVIFKVENQTFYGLIISESFGGFGAVMSYPCPFKVSDVIEAQFSGYELDQYEVVWIKKIDEEILKVGLRHLST